MINYARVLISDGSLGGVTYSVFVLSIWTGGGGMLIPSGGLPFASGCCKVSLGGGG